MGRNGFRRSHYLKRGRAASDEENAVGRMLLLEL